jgi:hypothetical protein
LVPPTALPLTLINQSLRIEPGLVPPSAKPFRCPSHRPVILLSILHTLFLSLLPSLSSLELTNHIHSLLTIDSQSCTRLALHCP